MAAKISTEAETTADFGITALGLGDPALQLKALQTWFIHRGNRFSYEHTLIAESDQQPAGLLLRFKGKDLPVLELNCAKQMFSIYGFRGAIKMVYRNKFLSNAREAEKDEYLIAHLAVDPQFRRRGIGELLLERASMECIEKGYSKLVLEVELDNDPALRLYQKFGFQIERKVELSEKSAALLHCLGFYKMVKNLSGGKES